MSAGVTLHSLRGTKRLITVRALEGRFQEPFFSNIVNIMAFHLPFAWRAQAVSAHLKVKDIPDIDNVIL